jgi:hypothetical protein
MPTTTATARAGPPPLFCGSGGRSLMTRKFHRTRSATHDSLLSGPSNPHMGSCATRNSRMIFRVVRRPITRSVFSVEATSPQEPIFFTCGPADYQTRLTVGGVKCDDQGAVPFISFTALVQIFVHDGIGAQAPMGTGFSSRLVGYCDGVVEFNVLECSADFRS